MCQLFPVFSQLCPEECGVCGGTGGGTPPAPAPAPAPTAPPPGSIFADRTTGDMLLPIFPEPTGIAFMIGGLDSVASQDALQAYKGPQHSCPELLRQTPDVCDQSINFGAFNDPVPFRCLCAATCGATQVELAERCPCFDNLMPAYFMYPFLRLVCAALFGSVDRVFTYGLDVSAGSTLGLTPAEAAEARALLPEMAVRRYQATFAAWAAAVRAKGGGTKSNPGCTFLRGQGRRVGDIRRLCGACGAR